MMRTEKGLTSEFNIEKGVRQGCVLSPSLFNLYTEMIFRLHIIKEDGVSIGVESNNNFTTC